MSSITTIISNSDGKVSLTQMDSKGFKFEEVNLNDGDLNINSLKVSKEFLKGFGGVKASIEKLDVSKSEKIPEFIAMIGNKLNEAIEVINILKAENELLKNKIETKVSLQDIDNSLSKIKRFEK
ncbi:hypothetical protein [Clostridium perfringens]|uniref:hypothetical protein n=1 Tax=Clostridium perfringens TaxID=1502 RepID=UPI0023F8ECAC|nr:hypothetical protein [Clostridium perfringens]WEV23440.1 hypothetical protein PL327_07025 [Clostridium perfringens D]HBZ6547092.1 hypothetical protein [Clostridium perfringens]